MTEPLLVIKGNPTDEEVAAVVAALTTLTTPRATPASPRPTGWSAYWRTLPHPGPAQPRPWRTDAAVAAIRGSWNSRG